MLPRSIQQDIDFLTPGLWCLVMRCPGLKHENIDLSADLSDDSVWLKRRWTDVDGVVMEKRAKLFTRAEIDDNLHAVGPTYGERLKAALSKIAGEIDAPPTGYVSPLSKSDHIADTTLTT